MIADLTEDLAAEQKARLTYDNILRLSDDPDVNDAIKFLRAREIVHFQRFGEHGHRMGRQADVADLPGSLRLLQCLQRPAGAGDGFQVR